MKVRNRLNIRLMYHMQACSISGKGMRHETHPDTRIAVEAIHLSYSL